ncbi:MAG: hypothetical protein M1521_08395 [Thermotogae bacterium]|jgi:hypothetical protein|nr:hypothetical protein [Thermotogota bacterium]
MGYIDLINRFWNADAAYAFSSYEVHLYFVLLDYANKSGWKEPLNLPNGRLIARMGCGEFAFMKARQRLHDLRMIRYEKGSTRQAGKYYYSDDYLAIQGNTTPILGVIPRQSHGNTTPILGTYIRQDKDKDNTLEINQNTDLSLPEPFSKRYPQEYQKLHKDLQGVIDLYELSVKPLEFDELPKLLNLNQQFTAGQIREAIQKFSLNGTLERFKEQGLEYIVKPLSNRMFGKPKGDYNADKKHNGSNVKQDAVKGPKFENGPDLSSIEYK